MLEYLLDGGFIMLPLLLLSVLAFAVILDRLQAFKAAEGAGTGIAGTVYDHIKAGDVEPAITACENDSGPVAAVLLVGLKKLRMMKELGSDKAEVVEQVNKAMDEYAPHVVNALEKRLNLLMLVASVSPLLGMTGTVTGMIASFDSMASAGGLDGGAVAGGISEALITTAAGLLVAIPAVTFYNLFSKKVDHHVLELENSASALVDCIAFQDREPAAVAEAVAQPVGE